ncbi:MAG: NmrA family NAD(P)-binding protein [Eubacterium sp.]|nr:NmrA family NAD(P)-binding protein [Eubacterium sp.]
MIEAFTGGDRIFFVSSIINGPHRVEQHKNVIDACKAAGVKHITYTSFFGANREGYHQYVLEDHRPTEAYLKASGIEYNIMRNNLYMENYLTVSVILAMLSNNVWGTNAKEGKATYIAKDDSAACAAALLLGKGERNKDYDLTSLTPISQRDICNMIAEKSGIDFKFVPMDDDEFRSYLEALHIPTTTDGDKSQSPVPFCTMDMVTNEGGIASGQMGVVSHDVEKLIGRKPLEVQDLLDTYSYVWKEKLTNIRQLH